MVIARKGQNWLSESGRSFHAATIGSSRLHRSDTVDLKKLLPKSSSVTWETLRVESRNDHLHHRKHYGLFAPLVTC